MNVAFKCLVKAETPKITPGLCIVLEREHWAPVEINYASGVGSASFWALSGWHIVKGSALYRTDFDVPVGVTAHSRYSGK